MEQHHAFEPQLKILLEYANHTNHVDYDAAMVCRIIEEMAPSFHRHLSDEIYSLLSMQPYNGAALLKVYKHCVAETTKQDKVCCYLWGLEFNEIANADKIFHHSKWSLLWYLACGTSLSREETSGLRCLSWQRG